MLALIDLRMIDACKRGFGPRRMSNGSAGLVGLVELVAVAARVLPCAGDSDADAFANTLRRLRAAFKTEIQLALPSPSKATH